jgi:hypothetical protein
MRRRPINLILKVLSVVFLLGSVAMIASVLMGEFSGSRKVSLLLQGGFLLLCSICFIITIKKAMQDKV